MLDGRTLVFCADFVDYRFEPSGAAGVDARPVSRWLGLRLVAEQKSSARPALHMQAGPRRRMRVMAGPTPLVWARIDNDHYGYWYLCNERADGQVVPPISFDEARQWPADSVEFDRAWARYFADALHHSSLNPLYRDRMFLAPAQVFLEGGSSGSSGRLPVPPVTRLRETLALPVHGFSDWDFGDHLPPLPTRRFSNESHGRIKALRKLVRDGQLPPILMMWFSGLDRYVILDGHDRLLASLIEGQVPKSIALLEVSERPPHSDSRRKDAVVREVERLLALRKAAEPMITRARPGITLDHANHLLVEAFDDRPTLASMTSAWPLHGGSEPWTSEVRMGLSAIDRAVEAVDFDMIA
ncbi:hypothetical protein AKJ09_01220 [Labilithrix luteola]|uniref:ParB/Sulfiredoxin domain-containing protein n=1 Tax=Labilithrix luteola TaxID=1391654 RepID=A0A0K1PMC6_9BACT|nr:hypothetical protein [Labilithrix luteola]AKU94556.1 hypothetical protein AKJ09_01220 [Labilithrix luteola]